MSDDNRHIRLPPERFYWAVLDASSLPRSMLPWRAGARRSKRFGYLFETHLPIGIDEVHATYTRCPQVNPSPGTSEDAGSPRDDHVLACAIELTALDDACDALSLAPSSLPPFVAHDAAKLDPGRLNLLFGLYLPAPVARAQSRLLVAVAIVLLAVTATITVALERRSAGWRTRENAAALATDAVYARALSPEERAGATHPSILLTAALRTAEREAGANAAAPPVDAAVTLSKLMSLWPRATDARVESLAVSQGTIELSAGVDGADDAEALAEALQPLGGWEMHQPRVSSGHGGLRVNLTFDRYERGERSP
jgi:hypothetical protein